MLMRYERGSGHRGSQPCLCFLLSLPHKPFSAWWTSGPSTRIEHFKESGCVFRVPLGISLYGFRVKCLTSNASMRRQIKRDDTSLVPSLLTVHWIFIRIFPPFVFFSNLMQRVRCFIFNAKYSYYLLSLAMCIYILFVCILFIFSFIQFCLLSDISISVFAWK